MSGDVILLRGIRVFAYHGVLDFEKRDGQTFIIDLELYTDLSAAGRSDALADTVDYGEVCKTVTEAMTERSYDLIERAAQAVCDRLLAQFPLIDRVGITLKKPSAPLPCEAEYAAVKILRGRS